MTEMYVRRLREASGLLALLLLGAGQLTAQDEIEFTAPDGELVYAYYYTQPEQTRARAIILTFHQGGADARGEYTPIIPRLLVEGFDVLAVDLRVGGRLFEGVNQTVKTRRGTASFCEAAADVDGALTLARSISDRPIILWGSSYSGTLVLRAADRGLDAIAAVLAFSPAVGPPMAGCQAGPVAAGIDIPALILVTQNEAGRGQVRELMDLFRSSGHEIFVATPGVHGSSMLVPSRVDGPVSGTWQTVIAFLDRTLPDWHEDSPR